MVMQLTDNAISAIVKGNNEVQAVVQVLQVAQTQGQGQRVKVLISDSRHTHQAILATQLTALVKSGSLQHSSIVRLHDYICNSARGSRIIMILNMEILMCKHDILGEPCPYTDGQLNSQLPSQSPSNFSVPVARDSHAPGAVSSAPYQPLPVYSNSGPIAKNQAPARIIPIAALNPYQGRWTIKARVTAKGDLRRFNNARGDGKVFSFDLLDSDGGEIRVTCFNAAADKFYDLIEREKVYIISKGNLKPAQRSYNHLQNDWEVFLDSSSIVDPCLEDNSIPKQHFMFTPISEVLNMENKSITDIAGVVISISPPAIILRKNGMETQKRTAQLKDMSGCSVDLTIWGSFCINEGQQLQEQLNSGSNPILAVKSGQVSDFSGKSIGTVSSTQLFLNPDLDEANELKNWFQSEGKHVPSQNITEDTASSWGKTEMRKTVAQIKSEGLGKSDKPNWILVKATVCFVKVDSFCYTACPLMRGDRQCNKKVNDDGHGNWYCATCSQTFPECDFRYLLQLQIQDHTGLNWVTAFQEAGEEIMGVTAKDLYQAKHEEEDDMKFAELVRKVVFNPYMFKIRIKEETYNDEMQVKCTIVNAEKLNYSTECKVLLDCIHKISA